jgi:hypothetical protein
VTLQTLLLLLFFGKPRHDSGFRANGLVGGRFLEVFKSGTTIELYFADASLHIAPSTFNQHYLCRVVSGRIQDC